MPNFLHIHAVEKHCRKVNQFSVCKIFKVFPTFFKKYQLPHVSYRKVTKTHFPRQENKYQFKIRLIYAIVLDYLQIYSAISLNKISTKH